MLYDMRDRRFPTRPIGSRSARPTSCAKASDLTFVAFGAMVPRALAVADTRWPKDGINVEVIDPRTTSPLDEDTILESVEKTGRLVVVDESPPRCQLAADISSMVADKASESSRRRSRR